MNLDSLGAFIGTVGVPTALCLALFIFFGKRDKESSEKLEKMRDTLDRNTRAIDKLESSIENSNREVAMAITELVKFLQRKGGE